MNKLSIFICENFSPEYARALEIEDLGGFADVFIKAYPCMCTKKRNHEDIRNLLQSSRDDNNDCLILCSKYCDIIKVVSEASSFELRTTTSCFNHFANESLIDYIVQKGGYTIGLGWLNDWRNHIENAGFDQDTARLFYRDFCKDLVFFDAGIDEKAEQKLTELSQFLELPYVIINFEIESIRILLRSIVYEWRLQKSSQEYTKTIAEAQSQCAEYSAILDLIGRISSYTNKRQTIEKIKEIFVMVLGTQNFKYWNSDYEEHDLPKEIKYLFANPQKGYSLYEHENRFCIRIQQNNKFYGVLDVSGFLFPQYIEKYLNFAIEIAKVCGLVLSNIEQYDKLLKSEKELQYLSFHDSLTGLYNRTYLNEILDVKKKISNTVVFVFDIDKMKYVNDNFGHLEGDKLISAVADILKNCFRDTDTVARIGGDEFLAYLPDCDMQMAKKLEDRIKETVLTYNKNQQESYLKVSLSIGFTAAENQEDTIEALIQRADAIMYEDKRKKKI